MPSCIRLIRPLYGARSSIALSRLKVQYQEAVYFSQAFVCGLGPKGVFWPCPKGQICRALRGTAGILTKIHPSLRRRTTGDFYKIEMEAYYFRFVYTSVVSPSSVPSNHIIPKTLKKICCNLVGQLGPALEELRDSIPDLDRVVIETSGSAFPATLAMEVNRLSRETGGSYALDGVVAVIDVENWKGYEDTSYTVKLQARFTDLVVFNKWEGAGEQRFDECLDRLGDLEGVSVAWVRSDNGMVPYDLVFGVDGGLAKSLGDGGEEEEGINGHYHDHAHSHDHKEGHQSEVEVISVTLQAKSTFSNVL